MRQTARLVVCQPWEESERGWGVRPDGFSLHLTMEDCRRFRKEYWAAQPPGPAPDEYSRESWAPFPLQVDAATFKQLAAAAEQHGIWVDQLPKTR